MRSALFALAVIVSGTQPGTACDLIYPEDYVAPTLAELSPIGGAPSVCRRLEAPMSRRRHAHVMMSAYARLRMGNRRRGLRWLRLSGVLLAAFLLGWTFRDLDVARVSAVIAT